MKTLISEYQNLYFKTYEEAKKWFDNNKKNYEKIKIRNTHWKDVPAEEWVEYVLGHKHYKVTFEVMAELPF